VECAFRIGRCDCRRAGQKRATPPVAARAPKKFRNILIIQADAGRPTNSSHANGSKCPRWNSFLAMTTIAFEQTLCRGFPTWVHIIYVFASRTSFPFPLALITCTITVHNHLFSRVSHNS
jgi:hypothetical protein